MRSIFWKEFNSFFSSLIGYMAISVFLILLGLIMFVFPDTSLLNYSYATLDQLFELAPWVFLILIPAITMRTLAEEKQYRTMELLVTQPISIWDIVLGKYFAALAISLLAILPTLIYYYTIYQLGSPQGNLDSGAIFGSYLGLCFLASIFCAIGIFASSLSQNQIVGFLMGALLCFICYTGFQLISNMPIFVGKLDLIIQQIGIASHYRSISRGLVVFHDIFYFIAVSIWFLTATVFIVNRTKS